MENTKEGVGRGYGKTILIGDQFVLFDTPAVLAAIPFETETRVTIRDSGSGWTLEDNRMEVPGYKAEKAADQVISFNRMIEVLGIDTEQHPLHIQVGGDLLAGSGVGASAAICVSFARACNELFAMKMGTREINHIAWEGEFGYHGLPSGVDNTVSTYGGVIEYKIVDEKKMFERIPMDEPVEVVLGNSGITSNTASLRGFLIDQQKEDQALFDKRLTVIRQQVSALKSALSGGDLREVGRIMTENHRILIDMGLSHERLVELCDLACSLGAYGAKVTGGGRGGYMVAVTPGEDLQDRVARAFEERDVPVIRASIGHPPTDPSMGEVLT